VESVALAGRTVLVVEDEPLICLDVSGRLADAGAAVLAAGRLDEALRLADHPAVSIAVLDFDLGDGDSTPVCWKLVDRAVPFLFHTGRVYRAFQQWPAAPVILKASSHELVTALAALCR
jgi:DNA-binding response OmpR family regulator